MLANEVMIEAAPEPVRIKFCPMCKQEKPVSAYSLQIKRGKVVPRTYCKPCNSTYSIAMKAKRNPDKKPKPARIGKSRRERMEAMSVWLSWRGPVCPGQLVASL